VSPTFTDLSLLYSYSDTTSPSSSASIPITIDGKTYDKKFETLNISDLSSVGDNEYPTFCFSKAYDTDGGSGIANYTIKVDGKDYLSDIPYSAPSVGGDVRQDGEYSVIKETSDYWYRYSNNSRPSETQEICIYGKGDSKKLSSGIHTWSVSAKDNAGNSVELSASRFLVKSSTGSLSYGHWFPVVVLKIGNRNFINQISTLNQITFDSKKPFSITTSNPTFYGIAANGSRIRLILEKETTDPQTKLITRETVTTQETTANALSQWGINLTKDKTTLLSNRLKEKPLYFATIIVEKDDKLALIKDIPVTLSKN
jgi:hypothetical protein